LLEVRTMLPDRLDAYENIKLKPCPMCGGLPMMLVMRQCMDSVVSIQCSACGTSSGGVMFANRRAQRELLPDLATARRQVARAWNERTGGHD